MIITENTTLEDLKNINNGEILKLTKGASLNKELFTFLLKSFPDSELLILSGYDKHFHYYSNNELYNEQETLILAENVNIARKHFNKDILFDGGFTVEQAITASGKINTIVGDISSARLNKKPLSTLEKFLWAYKETTNHFYKKEDEDESSAISRDLISILNGDKIVCAGFANMLFTLCNRLNIPCTLQHLIVGGNKIENHMTCVVRIDDDKYGIHGIFHSDPTFDCTKSNNSIYGKESFDFALVPYKHLDIIYSNGCLLDRLFSEDDIKPSSLNEIIEAKADIHRKKILSYLFPEKTHGLSQDEILKQQADEYLKQYNIENHIDTFLDSIDEQSAQEAHYEYIKSAVFNLSDFFEYPSKQAFKININTILQSLVSFGYSKPEITSMFKQYLTEDRIVSALKIWCEEIEEPNTPDYDYLFKSTYMQLKKHLDSTDDLINSFDFENGKTFNPDFELKKIVPSIVQTCVNNAISTQTQNNDPVSKQIFSTIGLLIKRGIPLEAIKPFLKTEFNSIDIRQLLFVKKHNDLSAYYSVNENNFYFEDGLTRHIYNEPYEEEFAKLSNLATPPSKDVLYTALHNIFLSQGNTKAMAKHLANEALLSSTFPFENLINNSLE